MARVTAMNAFVRVVEAGTFTKALDIPNTSLTRLIQRLEDELKVRLLERTTRSVTVTPKARATTACRAASIDLLQAVTACHGECWPKEQHAASAAL